MENTSDYLMLGLLLICMRYDKKVCYKMWDYNAGFWSESDLCGRWDRQFQRCRKLMISVLLNIVTGETGGEEIKYTRTVYTRKK